MEEPQQVIITHCIGYAQKPTRCEVCHKKIPLKSLQAGRIHRKSRTERKNKAKHTWCHFACWKVPEILTHLKDLEKNFRGFRDLSAKDKERVQKLVDQGVGASPTEQVEMEEPDEPKETLEKKKKKKKKEQVTKKKKKTDLTSALTGVQKVEQILQVQTARAKVSKPSKNKDTKKKKKKEESTLSRRDMQTLQSIAQEIQRLDPELKH